MHKDNIYYNIIPMPIHIRSNLNRTETYCSRTCNDSLPRLVPKQCKGQILHRLSLLSFSFCSIKATRAKICKKSVCFYWICNEHKPLPPVIEKLGSWQTGTEINSNNTGELWPFIAIYNEVKCLWSIKFYSFLFFVLGIFIQRQMSFVIQCILYFDMFGCKILRKHTDALSHYIVPHWHQNHGRHSWTLGNER